MLLDKSPKQTTQVVLQITLFVERLGALFYLAVYSSSGILRRLGDVPVITCRSLSRCAEGNVPLRVLLQVQPWRRSNVGFILQPERLFERTQHLC